MRPTEAHGVAEPAEPPEAGSAGDGTLDVAAVTEQAESTGSITDAKTPPWAERVGNSIAAVLLPLGVLTIFGCVGVTLAEVIERYFLDSDFTSSADILSILFAWLAFFGMPRAIWFERVPRLGVTRFAHGQVRNVLDGMQVGATLAFFGLIIWSYFSNFTAQVHTDFLTVSLPLYVQGLSIPIGFGLMGVMTMLRSTALATRPMGVLGVLLGVGGVFALLWTTLAPDAALLIGVIVLLLLNAPVAVALGVGGVAMFFQGNVSQISVPADQLVSPLSNIALLAIPLFMFMGAIVARSKLSTNLSRFVQALLGWLPGGSGVACVGTSALFANLSGSAIADTAAVGSFYVPQLLRSGYSRERAGALQAAAGVVGVVFPPAIAMILYSTVAAVNVIEVFEAVIVPGVILVAVMMAITIGVDIAKRETHRVAFSAHELVRSIPGVLPVLVIPAILDGGILSGIFTPAESGAVAIVVTIVLGWMLRSVGPRSLWTAGTHAVDAAAMIMFILVATAILDYGFTTSGVQSQVNSLLAHAGHSRLLLLLIINAIFVIIHEFVDAAPSILVVVPLIVPAAILLGVPLLQLGVVIAINSTIGAVSPPVGVNLYVAGGLAGIAPSRLIRPVLIYIAGSAAVLTVVTLVPVLSTWLPSVLHT